MMCRVCAHTLTACNKLNEQSVSLKYDSIYCPDYLSLPDSMNCIKVGISVFEF